MKRVPLVLHKSETEIAQYRISHDKGTGGGQSVIQRYENTSDIGEKEHVPFSCKISRCENLRSRGAYLLRNLFYKNVAFIRQSN